MEMARTAGAVPAGGLDTMIARVPTGVPGLDEVLHGGLPRGRLTLVEGGPGNGRSALALAMLVATASAGVANGAFVSFEASVGALHHYAERFGWDLEALAREQQLRCEHVQVPPRSVLANGSFDLSGLRERILACAARVDAELIFLDAAPALAGPYLHRNLFRAELRWLYSELIGRDLTVVVTGPPSDPAVPASLEDARLADCVLRLGQRREGARRVRTLRVTKYRGSAHEPDERALVMDARGPLVLPRE